MLNAMRLGHWTGIGLTEQGMQLVEQADREDAHPDDPWQGDSEGANH